MRKSWVMTGMTGSYRTEMESNAVSEQHGADDRQRCHTRSGQNSHGCLLADWQWLSVKKPRVSAKDQSINNATIDIRLNILYFYPIYHIFIKITRERQSVVFLHNLLFWCHRWQFWGSLWQRTMTLRADPAARSVRLQIRPTPGSTLAREAPKRKMLYGFCMTVRAAFSQSWSQRS